MISYIICNFILPENRDILTMKKSIVSTTINFFRLNTNANINNIHSSNKTILVRFRYTFCSVWSRCLLLFSAGHLICTKQIIDTSSMTVENRPPAWTCGISLYACRLFCNSRNRPLNSLFGTFLAFTSFADDISTKKLTVPFLVLIGLYLCNNWNFHQNAALKSSK